MFTLLLKRTLLQDPVRTWRVVFAVALGAAVTSSVLGVSIGIGDQVEREFRSYGANIQVTGKSTDVSGALTLGGVRYAASDRRAAVPTDKLGALKTVFWRYNITGFTPFLSGTFPMSAAVGSTGAPTPPLPVKVTGTWFHQSVPVPDFPSVQMGIRQVQPWWRVSGAWPLDSSTDCLVGSDLAQSRRIHTGSRLAFQVGSRTETLLVSGILHTGGAEDDGVVAPLAIVQDWTGQKNRAERLEVSALVKPDDALAHKNPAKLSDADRERLSCSPYISSITSEIEEALPGVVAHPIYRVAEGEGKLLDRIRLLISFVLGAALLASILGAGSATAAAAIQRRTEMALVKALGAPVSSLIVQIVCEATILGLFGGLLGVPMGMALQSWIGRVVFGAAAAPPLIVIPVGLALALIVAIVSSLLPLWSALHVDPSRVLGGE